MFFMSYSHTSNSGISVPLPFVDFLDGPNCSAFVLTTWLSQFSEFASSSLEVTDSQSSFYNCIDLLNSFTQSWQVHALGFLIFDDLRQDRVAVATQNQFCLYYRFIASWPFSWHWLIAIILTFQIENLSDRLITFSISLDGSILPHIRSFAHLHIAILGHLGHPIWVIQFCLQFSGFQFDFFSGLQFGFICKFEFFFLWRLSLQCICNLQLQSFDCQFWHCRHFALAYISDLIIFAQNILSIFGSDVIFCALTLHAAEPSRDALPWKPDFGAETQPCLGVVRYHVCGIHLAFAAIQFVRDLQRGHEQFQDAILVANWRKCTNKLPEALWAFPRIGFSPQVQHQSDRRELHLGARSIVQSFTVHSRPPSTPCKAWDPHRGPGCIFGAFGTAGASSSSSNQCRLGSSQRQSLVVLPTRCHRRRGRPTSDSALLPRRSRRSWQQSWPGWNILNNVTPSTTSWAESSKPLQPPSMKLRINWRNRASKFAGWTRSAGTLKGWWGRMAFWPKGRTCRRPAPLKWNEKKKGLIAALSLCDPCFTLWCYFNFACSLLVVSWFSFCIAVDR